MHCLVARLAGMLPNAEVATIDDDDDHLLPLRSPDALGRLVAEFAGRRSAAGSAAPGGASGGVGGAAAMAMTARDDG